MRQAAILYKREVAGLLTQLDDGRFEFAYTEEWLNNIEKPAISLTLPKRKQKYTSDFLFPFFYNMLPEGTNRQMVCYENKIDKKDDFGILLTTAGNDTIGAVQVKKI